jgi:hypothetical protein
MVEQDDEQDLRVDALVPPSPEERAERLARARAHKLAIAVAAGEKGRKEADAAASLDMESAMVGMESAVAAPTAAPPKVQTQTQAKEQDLALARSCSWDAVAKLQRSLVDHSRGGPASPLPKDLQDSWWIRRTKLEGTKLEELSDLDEAEVVGDSSPASVMDALCGTQSPPTAVDVVESTPTTVITPSLRREYVMGVVESTPKTVDAVDCEHAVGCEHAVDHKIGRVRWHLDEPKTSEWPHHLDELAFGRFDASASLSPVPECEATMEGSEPAPMAATGDHSSQLPARASYDRTISSEEGCAMHVDAKLLRRACQQLIPFAIMLLALLLLCWWHYQAPNNEMGVEMGVQSDARPVRRGARRQVLNLETSLKSRLTRNVVLAIVQRVQGWGMAHAGVA